MTLQATVPKDNQVPVRVTADDGAPVYPGDVPNKAIRVNVVAGGGSSTALISTLNSTTTPLGAGGIFTGTFEEILDFHAITVVVAADQDSAADGLEFQWSTDGVTVGPVEILDFKTANGARAFNQTRRARFFRVKYTNGATPQTTFVIQTILSPGDIGFLARGLTRALDDHFTAQLVRAVITGVTTGGGGGYVNVKVSPSGAVQIGGDINIDKWGNIATTLGQKLMAASVPVVLASDQSILPVDVADEPTRDLGKVDVASLDQYAPVAGRLPVDGSGVTQPVSGTVTANKGTPDDWRTDQRRGLTVGFAVIAASASGDNTIVAAAPGLKTKVLSYVIVADAAVAARWKSAAVNKSGAMSLAANGGVVAPPVSPAGGHWMETGVNEALILNLGAAIGVNGHISYVQEA